MIETIIGCILTISIILIPIIIHEYKENKEKKQYEREHLNFIEIREIGINEQHLGLPTTQKKYGEKYIICPKCKSKKVICISNLMNIPRYKCMKCEYEGYTY